MLTAASRLDVHRAAAVRRSFWAGVWLAIVLVAIKAYHLGVPRLVDPGSIPDYVLALAAISYADVWLAIWVWVVARVALRRPRAPGRGATARLATRAVPLVFLGVATLACLYAVVNVLLFDIFGRFLTYPILALVGDVRMVRSSVGAHLTPGAIMGLVGVPLAYLALVLTTRRLAAFVRQRVAGARWTGSIAFAVVSVWTLVGHNVFVAQWGGRTDRRIAENAHTVFLASWWQAVSGGGAVRMPEAFPEEDLADFRPIGEAAADLTQASSALVRRASAAISARAAAARRPPNVILVVLESVAAQWTSLHSSLYETTPVLEAESSRGLVFDSFYAHIGRSSNSLASMLLSQYPKLDFREVTVQYPALPGTSLAAAFRDRGYLTAFVTPSDLSWAGWRQFLDGRGFADVLDYRDLECPDLLSSWGVEDRCMIERMVGFVEQAQTRPFFLMGWTTQTHDPYEPSPGVPLLELLREPVPDEWKMGRYLNVLRQTDTHLGRLFDAVRRTGLERDTLIVVTGDHGQAFGYPHDTYFQGWTVYEEDVRVPLLVWFPRAYRSPLRSKTVGGHVDLAPTIAALAGFPPAPDWQGRSLLDSRHPRRAYFYVAEDQFRLGVREGPWKYIYDLRDGTEQLFDLDRDPLEQRNLASSEAERCARLRQRLAAWVEANRQQYERLTS